MQNSVSGSTDSNVFKLTSTGLLIAIGILIPMFIPGIRIEPASYTLAVHVPIFIAMFISPKVAIGVVLGTTIGFQLSGFSLPVVFRAASHLIWALPGAIYLSKIDKLNLSGTRLRVFSLIIALIHGAGELTAVVLFYFGTSFPENQGLAWLFVFVGIGTVIHSMIDLEIANIVRLALQRQRYFRMLMG